MMDVYPSTDDVVLGMDVVDEAIARDDVIACIEEAGRRYAQGGTRGVFIASPTLRALGFDGEGIIPCCAVGSLMLADGVTEHEFAVGREAAGARPWIEGRLSDTAKAAMAVLDAVAAERWPNAVKACAGAPYFGPLEALNEDYWGITGMDLDNRRAEMARIYALAVERLRAQAEPAIEPVEERELALV